MFSIRVVFPKVDTDRPGDRVKIVEMTCKI